MGLILCFLPYKANAEEELKPLVIIDPGHGGKYYGTAGYSGSKTGYYEKHANIQVSERLRKSLETKGYEVFMTRSSDNNFSTVSSSEDLKQRTRVANNAAIGRNDNTIFISIHHNATSSPSYSGYETYYYDAEQIDPSYPPDPMQIVYSDESHRLAKLTHASVINSGANTEGRGIVHYSLYVTRNAQMPSILAEVEYMSNPYEEKKVKTATFQQGIANALAIGVDNYFNLYIIQDSKGKQLKTFTNSQDALTYAKTLKNVKVFYKKSGKYIFNNISFDYRAYHTSVDLAQTKFISYEEAVAFTKAYKNTRVVHHPTGKVVWSNYLVKRFDLVNANAFVTDQYFREHQAVNDAITREKVTVKDNVSSSIVYSSIVTPSFDVYHATKGKLKSFFNQEEAIAYAKLWPSTRVANNTNNTTIYTNTNTTEVAKTSVTVKGQTRYGTSIEVSKMLYPTGFPSDKADKTIVIATGVEYADALSAGPLAAQYGNAPILLNPSGSLPVETIAEIKRLGGNHIILVGGGGAISAGVENELRIKFPTAKVERISGADRYATNDAINNRLSKPSGIFVVSGKDYPDALAASAIAVNKNYHIILTDGTTYRESMNEQVYSTPTFIVGGTSVVSDTLMDKIKERAGADLVKRLSGKDRYATNAALIEQFSDSLQSPVFLVSTGLNYPDALVTSALAAKYGAPLYLVQDSLPDALKPSLTTYLKERVTTTSIYTGGVVTDQVKKQIDILK